MCLNANRERQFEFVQQTWVQNSAFHGLAGERDPLLGSREQGNEFTIPTRERPTTLRYLPEFVGVLGGGYFFVPGKSFLEFLASA